MDINRLTQKVQESLAEASTISWRNGQQEVDVEHLLAALLEQEQGLAVSVLRKAGVEVEKLKNRVKHELGQLPKVSSNSADAGGIRVTGRTNRLFLKAEEEAKRLKDDFISVEHLLLATLDDAGSGGRALKDLGTLAIP